MTLHEYQRSQAISSEPFYALIQAAMRKADSWNLAKLRTEWPDVWDELHARYHAPGGLLPGDPGYNDQWRQEQP